MVWLLVIIITFWGCGAVLLRFTEGRTNPDFDTMAKAVWNIAVYLFSGLDSGQPRTVFGQICAAAVLILSAGVVAVFTGEIASFLVERKLGSGRKMPVYKLQGHFVICNWNDKAVPIIQELHADVVKNKYPIVVISENLEAAELPDEDDDPRFREVYLVKGDPASEIVLKRASVASAYSVVILANPEDGDMADAKSVLVAMAIRHVCETADGAKTHICVEGVSPQNVEHLRRAGADEIVAASDFGTMLLSQTALRHGLAEVYRDLLRESDDTNEVYTAPIPKEYVGKTFTELGAALFSNRTGKANPAILIGIRDRNGYAVNPRADEPIVLKEDDLAVVISFERPDTLL